MLRRRGSPPLLPLLSVSLIRELFAIDLGSSSSSQSTLVSPTILSDERERERDLRFYLFPIANRRISARKVIREEN